MLLTNFVGLNTNSVGGNVSLKLIWHFNPGLSSVNLDKKNINKYWNSNLKA